MEWSSKVQNPRQTNLSFPEPYIKYYWTFFVLQLMSGPACVAYRKMQQDIPFHKFWTWPHLDPIPLQLSATSFFYPYRPAAVLMQCLSVAKNNRWKETSISSHNTSCKPQCLLFFQKYFSVEKKSITVQKSSALWYVDGSVPLFLFNQW